MNLNNEYINWLNLPTPPTFTTSPEEEKKLHSIAFADYCLNKVEGRHLWLFLSVDKITSQHEVLKGFADQPKLSEIMFCIEFADMTPNQVKNIMDNGSGTVGQKTILFTKVVL